ncbi:hypothetical protein [Cupriavidus metallidurans]|uniref:Uncharacterized protein n=1 Tax=Cupriavidus metallidurans TaxID=119219 RepID=A0A482J0V0_9BURK|nr:hypothetical protein [Cupriavidus metallidurans]QBP14361.1 hypothetical protein DDF84_032045 [Cupriavidus metallidurans]
MQGQTIIDHWLRLDPAIDMFEKLDSRGAMFCSWSKTERNQRFASLLSSFDLMFGIEGVQQTAGSVSPRELKRWEGVEWPDPNW